MLLYLTSDENIELFDFLQEEKNMLIKKYSGEIYFRNFIFQDMKSLEHYSYVVVDLKATRDEEKDLLESLLAFKKIYSPKLIILAQEIDNLFLSRLVKSTGIYDVLISKDIQGIKDELEMCLSHEEKFREEFKRYLKKLNLRYSFTKKNEKILIAGVKSIFGTTKVAINLATALAELGASVSYTEVNPSGYLKRIENYYKFKDQTYKDVVFFQNGDVPLDFNFNIIDIGILKEKNLKPFNSNDIAEIKILCGSAKESELEELIEVLKVVDDKTNLILSFTNLKEKNTIKKLLKDKNNLYFIDDTVALFDTKNSSIYREILAGYITENNK